MLSSILTYTGKWFDVLRPDPTLIDISDIAAALSKLCRFGGHCKKFYSVAEHSITSSKWMGNRYQGNTPLRIWALLHDASEAYMVDIPRPVKRQLQEYVRLEDAIQHSIAVRFGLPWPMPEEVHIVDHDMLAMELRAYMPYQPEHKLPSMPSTSVACDLASITLTPDLAETAFHAEALSLGLK